MIHIYYGDGKGKTTAALGLALRACGAGKKVAFYSFLKDNSSSERLAECDIAFYENPAKLPFLFNMSDAEKKSYALWAERAVKDAFDSSADVIVLDEFLDVLALLGEDFEKSLIFCADREYVITGHVRRDYLFERANYITHMVKERHPFDSGTAARRGIEC